MLLKWEYKNDIYKYHMENFPTTIFILSVIHLKDSFMLPHYMHIILHLILES